MVKLVKAPTGVFVGRGDMFYSLTSMRSGSETADSAAEGPLSASVNRLNFYFAIGVSKLQDHHGWPARARKSIEPRAPMLRIKLVWMSCQYSQPRPQIVLHGHRL